MNATSTAIQIDDIVCLNQKTSYDFESLKDVKFRVISGTMDRLVRLIGYTDSINTVLKPIEIKESINAITLVKKNKRYLAIADEEAMLNDIDF